MKRLFGSWSCCPLAGSLLLASAASAAELDEIAPDFALAQRGTNTVLRLADCRGTVLVLDFFAYWCVPCVRASAEVEAGLRQFYEERRGNAHGVPVRVQAVNIETAHPEKTAAFIQRAGLTHVLEDPQGEVFQRFGGSGLPFLVIMDCTGGVDGTAPAKVLYRHAGFEGVPALRTAIDTVGLRTLSEASPTNAPANRQTAPANLPPPDIQPVPPSPAAPAEATAPPASDLASASAAANPVPSAGARGASGAGTVHTAFVDSSFLFASDILLTDTSIEYRQTRPASELAVSLTHGHIGVDYVPESALWEENDVNSERYGGQVRGKLDWGERWTLHAGGGGYDGFMDYRSLWLDEHFRQLYSRRPGYEDAEPWGWNASAGLRWEYLPSAGFLQADLSFQHDIISPGYEVQLGTFPPQLVRFRDDYDTVSGRLSSENVLTPRLRALHELSIVSTTDRELRFTLQSSLNYAPAEHWVLRTELAGTKEDPRFEAWHVGVTVEHDWNETWFIGLMGRFYQDNGQIENALLAENTAAPPLDTIQAGLSVRWQGRQSSLRLFAGPLFARYCPEGPSGTTFAGLYRDRNWFSVQFAFAREL